MLAHLVKKSALLFRGLTHNRLGRFPVWGSLSLSGQPRLRASRTQSEQKRTLDALVFCRVFVWLQARGWSSDEIFIAPARRGSSDQAVLCMMLISGPSSRTGRCVSSRWRNSLALRAFRRLTGTLLPSSVRTYVPPLSVTIFEAWRPATQ